MSELGGYLLFVAEILATLSIAALWVSVWIWVCLGVRKSGFRHLSGAVAVQLSVVSFVVAILKGANVWAVLVAAFPPILLTTLLGVLSFGQFLSQVLPLAGAWGAGVFALCMLVPRLRVWSVAPTILALLAAGLVVGERVSQSAMACQAEAHEMSRYERNSLLWSLRNVPGEYETDAHAMAWKGDMFFYWSYRDMNWYEIKLGMTAGVNGPLADCG